MTNTNNVQRRDKNEMKLVCADPAGLGTHSLIGHTDDSGVAADHQEDEAEKRHVPSATQKTQTISYLK